MISTKYVSGFVIGLLILAIGLSLLSPKIWMYQKKKVFVPDYSFVHLTVTQINQGKVIWRINAMSAFLDKKSQRAVLNHPIGVYWPSQDHVLRIKADEATISLEKWHIFGKGRVEIQLQESSPQK